MTPASRLWLCVGVAGGVMLSVTYSLLEQTGPGRGLAVVSAVCGIGVAAMGLPMLPGFERVDAGHPGGGAAPSNNRFQLRILAWRSMKLVLTPDGQRGVTAELVNISASGLAVDWTAETVPVGARIRIGIAG